MTAPSSPPPALFHDAFYRFVRLAWPDDVAAQVVAQAGRLGLTGSVIVAPEGLNGTVAGAQAALDAFRHELQNDPAFGGAFAGLPFRRSSCRTPPFGRLRVHRKPALVALGFDVGDAAVPSAAGALSPSAWRALIARPDVVVLDNRNGFEYRLGRFRGALDPGVGRFRDFPDFVDAHAAQWRAEGKQVAMYCTGGIRCEKTAGWLRQRHGLPVLQLEGGILHHFAEMPDAARDWEGECFVFDNRIALDTRLQETATTAEQVFAGEPDAEWRLARARRLAGAVATDEAPPDD